MVTLAVLAASLATACATTAPPPAATPGPGGAAPATSAAWTLPAAALGSQRLYRVSFDGGEEGGGSFRLTLLLADAERYQVRTVDPLGRALWTLDVAGDEGLWRDHRNRVWCPLQGAFDLAAARLAPFPLSALPALLLGRLPAPPEAPPETNGDRLAFRDGQGRRWTARLEGGLPVAWAMYDGDEPSLLWSREADEAYLSDRLRGTQMRWRQTLAEPLPTPVAAALEDALPAPPAEGYRPVDCATAYVPEV